MYWINIHSNNLWISTSIKYLSRSGDHIDIILFRLWFCRVRMGWDPIPIDFSSPHLYQTRCHHSNPSDTTRQQLPNVDMNLWNQVRAQRMSKKEKKYTILIVIVVNIKITIEETNLSAMSSIWTAKLMKYVTITLF